MKNTKDMCEYIAICDYFEYHIFLNTTYGLMPLLCFTNLSRRQRVMRHKMYTLSFDMILRGEY